jgi:hypothetical protein
MNTLKEVLKSRTVLFAIAVAVLSVLQGFVVTLPLTPTTQMLIGIVIAVAVVILRVLTTSPLIAAPKVLDFTKDTK